MLNPTDCSASASRAAKRDHNLWLRSVYPLAERGPPWASGACANHRVYRFSPQ